MISADTIVAPATPYGHSAIGLIRISGPKALKILKKITKTKNFTPNFSIYKKIFNNNNLIDSGVVTYFEAPKSYNGENIVEISCHGSPSIVDNLIDIICSLGARTATPGEFTQRAFINGKLDLIQVEAISSLIASKTIRSASAQQKILSGELSAQINSLRHELVSILSNIEHTIDILEEDVLPDFYIDIKVRINDMIKNVNRLISSFSMGKLLNTGATVVITGKPNTGKSTLINSLSGINRSIVSDIPGTTRDTLEVELVLAGIPLKFIDTAGIRESSDEIEMEGVNRANVEIKNSDLIILIHDDKNFFKDMVQQDNTIFVLNKCDSTNQVGVNNSIIHISAKNKLGLDNLLLEIKNRLGFNEISNEAIYLSTNRQHDTFKTIKLSLFAAYDLINHGSTDLELFAFELKNALVAFEKILGKTTPDDILNNIFDSLCVGK